MLNNRGVQRPYITPAGVYLVSQTCFHICCNKSICHMPLIRLCVCSSEFFFLFFCVCRGWTCLPTSSAQLFSITPLRLSSSPTLHSSVALIAAQIYSNNIIIICPALSSIKRSPWFTLGPRQGKCCRPLLAITHNSSPSFQIHHRHQKMKKNKKDFW